MRCPALSVLATLSAPLLGGCATPLVSPWDGMKVKHAWGAVPKNWESLGHPSNETTIEFYLALKSHRGDALVEALYEISDPEHSRYVYKHVETNDTVFRTISYSLLEVLHGHIQTIVPTTYFGSPLTEGMSLRPRMHLSTAVEARGKAGSVLSSRDRDGITPSYLHWLYKSLGYVPKATFRNALGIDLALFMTEYRTDGEDATFTVTQINGGGYDPGIPALEANLDVQYAEAMAYPTPHIFYSTPSSLIDDPYIRWLRDVIAQDDDDIPRTISTSYGRYEYIMPCRTSG
ncbi:hypothetical protein EDB85DRAFT_2150397 [Lactarius pseudohatsudake]|nr:hypothetical protein EDB85DRAFT_2150397 [Lactarius pseudohatsudake]